jgi:hypothetical protein
VPPLLGWSKETTLKMGGRKKLYLIMKLESSNIYVSFFKR